MAHQASSYHLESKDILKMSHGFYAILHGLRVRGSSPHRLRIWLLRAKAYEENSNRTFQEDALDQLEESPRHSSPTLG